MLANIEVTTHPSDVEAIVGGSVSLSCDATGGRFDSWLHKDQSVTDGGDYNITSTDTSSTMEITSFKAELAGEYRCRFVSDDGAFLSLPGKVTYFGKASKRSQNFFSSLEAC